MFIVGHAPNYLNQFIPASHPNNYGHRHHRTDYIAARTNKYKFSFFPIVPVRGVT